MTAALPQPSRHTRRRHTCLAPSRCRIAVRRRVRLRPARGPDLGMLMALLHAADADLRSGRAAEQDAQGALLATVLGAVSDDGTSR
jgi:hypothetical protein